MENIKYETILGDNSSMQNITQGFGSNSPFLLLPVKIVFGVLYSVVFVACITGNALVMFVIIRHQRMRNITNIFLANLAAADLSVGVFCVIPNLMTYFTPYWYAGKVMCKLYFFIQCVSYTGSIIILTVISVERYFAIIHPMLSKRYCSMSLMRLVMLVAWLVAAAYGFPILIVFDTVQLVEYGNQVTFCVNSGGHLYIHTLVIVNFALWYCLPLLLLCILYARISVVLGRSAVLNNSGNNIMEIDRNRDEATVGASDMPAKLSIIGDRALGSERYFNRRSSLQDETDRNPTATDQETMVNDHHLKTRCVPNVLLCRRRVIRLLIAIVLCFAACMLPHHVRLLYELWVSPSSLPTFGHQLVPPITFLFFYLNSVLNPILYAFLSANFRMHLKEAVGLRRKRNSFPLRSVSMKSSRNTFYRSVSRKLSSDI